MHRSSVPDRIASGARPLSEAPPTSRLRVPRLRSALAIAVLIAVAAGMTGGLGIARAQTASVEVTPSVAAPGEEILVLGFGFQDGETVTISLGDVEIATDTVNGGGAFQVAATVPADIPTGTHQLDAIGDLGSEAALDFEVIPGATPTPTATPTPLPQPTATSADVRALPEGGAFPGEFVTVTGGGFGPGEAVTVSLDGTDLVTVGSTIGGAFLANVVVPLTTAPGTHRFEATGANGMSLTVDYEILVPPTPTPTPVPTSEPTAEPTATPTPAPTSTPIPAPPPGDPSDEPGTSGRWSAFPTLLIGLLTVLGAVVAGIYIWTRPSSTAV